MGRDAAAPVYDHFSREAKRRHADNDLSRLLRAHAANPFGPHEDDLARVLNFFRAQDTRGKYLILSMPDKGGWRLATITGRRDEGSVSIDDEQVYRSHAEAEHAAFRKRLHASGLLTPAEYPT